MHGRGEIWQMDIPSPQIVRQVISRALLENLARAGFGDMVKAVVDVSRGVMAIGAELHSDEEADLLTDGSRQTDLWGINLYPADEGESSIEFDSMINVRPGQGNRSRSVDDDATRQALRPIVDSLVSAA